MGTRALNSRFAFLITLLLCLLFSSAQLFAQGETEVSVSKSSWRDWLAFRVALSVNDVSVPLKSSNVFPQAVSATPQLGVRVHLGLIFDRQSDDPLVHSLGFAKARNIDKRTKEALEATTLLDVGVEYPIWNLLNKKKHQLRFDLGAFGAMCHIAYPNSKGLNKWGVSGRISLAYDYKLQKDYFVGCKLYNSIGRYFGASQSPNDLRFSYINELGLSMCVTF